MQQDLAIKRRFDINKIIDIMEKEGDKVQLVRYVWGNNKFHESYTKAQCQKTLPEEILQYGDFYLSSCSQWSDNNHIAKRSHYDKYVWANVKDYNFMEHSIICSPDKSWGLWYLGLPNDGDYIKNLNGRTTN